MSVIGVEQLRQSCAAVTIGRTLTDTFSGIQPAHAPAFIASQFAGALVALAVMRWIVLTEKEPA